MDITFYNFALAFVICAIAFVIGEVVSTLTKAWVPSVFVTAVVMLGFYWVAGAKYTEVVSTAQLIPFGSTIGIYLLITHMGTVISIKQLVEQWKTIVVCLLGLLGMCLACWFICPCLWRRTSSSPVCPPSPAVLLPLPSCVMLLPKPVLPLLQCLPSPCTASRALPVIL